MMNQTIMLALLSLAAAVMIAGCERTPTQPRGETETPVEFPAELLGRFYLANGFLEMDQFQNAAAIYEELLDKSPTAADLVKNLRA